MQAENPRFFLFFKGRVALYAILRAMGVGKGDEVILPGFTCVVVPNAITYLGAKPVYIDIDPRTFNIDPQKLESENGKTWSTDKAKAVIVQHTFGIPADMDRVAQSAKRHNLYVIEDCCHSAGSTYKNRPTGSLGDAAFFSSQWSKPVTTGLGGWAVVNNESLRQRMERIYPQFLKPNLRETAALKIEYFAYLGLFRPSLFWFVQNTYRFLSRHGLALGSSSNEELKCKMPARYELRMSSWQQDLLKKQLKTLDEIILKRKAIVNTYNAILLKEGFSTLATPNDCECILLRYPLLTSRKNTMLNAAEREKIEIGDWFLSPVHPLLYEWDKISYYKGLCPISEEICSKIINLPTHSSITNEQIETTIKLYMRYC